MKKIAVRKSVAEGFIKSLDSKKLEYFKRELLKILDSQEKEEEKREVSKAFAVNELYKSMTDPLYMAKGGKVGAIGEIRTWNGKKYKKMPDKKWVRVYDKETRGAKLAIAALRRKIDACTDSQELLKLVLANKERFQDNQGRPLPIIQELSKYVSSKNDSLETPAKKIENKDNSRKNALNDIDNAKKEKETEKETEKDEKTQRQEYVKKLIDDTCEKYKNDSYVKYSSKSIVKKYGKKRLEEIANMNVKNEEDYKKWLNDEITKIEDEKGPSISDNSIENSIWKHYFALYEKQAAIDKLKSMEANEKTPDIPVDEKDMQEAENIIGADVRRILDGRDTWGNTKQTLTDKIKRRIRNNPGVARAMLVLIKQEQERTGKTVYTEKHSIWDELPKLNENAREAAKNGESETKTGVSGNLYEGDDGTTVVENKDWGRYQISFPGKPSAETISMLKHNGFRWSPKTQTWVCFNTANGEYSLKRVAEKLGLKKTENVQKSYSALVNEIAKSFFDKFGA